MARRYAILFWAALGMACTGKIISPPNAGGPTDASTVLFPDATATDAATGPFDAASAADAGFMDVGAGPADAATGDTGYANGAPRFVFVGDEGVWASSSDGRQWSQSPPTGRYEDLLRDIVFGDGRFYAVGGGNDVNVVLGSEDGVTWVPLGGPTNGWIGAAAWLPSESALVVAGSNGLRLRSLDQGRTFVDEGPFASGHFRAAVYGGGRVVAVGDSYDTTPSEGMSSTTEDGRQWTPVVTGGPPFTSVTYGNGLFVAVGNAGRVARSTDGQQWADITLPGSPFIPNVSFGDGRFLLSAAGVVYESTDAVTWTSVGPGPDLTVYGNGMWVGSNFVGQSYVSSDGRQWTTTEGAGLPGRAAVFGWLGP